MSLTQPAEWAAHWESMPLPYRIDLRSYRWHCYDKMLRRVLGSGGGRLLEVGSGACQWLQYFEERFAYQAYGVDYSLAACQVGVRNLGLLGADARVTCADLFRPPFVEGAFDVVFSDGVIEHFEDFASALAPMAGLLKPGGKLLATVPNFAGAFGSWRRRLDPDLYRQHRPITPDELTKAFLELGLADVEVVPFCSIRFPYGPIAGPLAPARLLTRAADKVLTSAYRAFGRGLESPYWSAEIYAVGSRR